MKKQILPLLSIFFISTNLFAQQDYFVVDYKDTTYCEQLKYSCTVQGWLDELTYTTEDGKKESIEGRKNVPNVTTFYIKGRSIDRTPVKAHKPDSYIRYTERTLDGKIRVYAPGQGYNSDFEPSGTYRFIALMPDGTWYQINKKNMKKYIRPYLEQCAEFMKNYSGDFSTDEGPAVKMFAIYNLSCK